MRIFKLFLILMLSQSASSQILLQKQSIDFDRRPSERNVHTLIDEKNLETYVFFQDKQFFKVFQYSLAFLSKDSMDLTKLDPKWHIIGSRMDSIDRPQLFWVNDEFSEIISLTYDLNQKLIKNSSLVNLAHQEFVCQMFTHQNIFYVLTISQRDPWFRIYEFKNLEKPIITTFRFPEYTIDLEDNKKLTFNKIFNHKSAVEFPFTLEYIKAEQPSDLLSVVKKRKMYVENGKLIMSFDFNPKQTHWIIVDLASKKESFKITPFPDFSSDLKNKTNYNSFLIKDQIFTIQNSKSEIQLGVSDWNGHVLSKFKAHRNEEISFKNGPSYFQPKQNKEARMFRKNKYFIKKLRASHLGISAYASDDQLWVVAGGLSENLQLSYVAGDVFLSAMLAIAGQGYGYIPMLQNFTPSDYKTSFFELKMNLNFQPQAGEMPMTSYVKINQFLQEIPEAEQLIIFRRGLYDVLGYYLPKERQFYFRQFLP